MRIPLLSALVKDAPDTLLALDPGGTTGWSFWRGHELVLAGQQQILVPQLDEFLDRLPAAHWVIEDYRVYDWASKYHTFSSLETVRLIGALEHAAAQRSVTIHEEMAAAAKRFATNDKLQAWGVFQPGLVHANDSIRHACYWLVVRPKTAPAAHKHTHRVG